MTYVTISAADECRRSLQAVVAEVGRLKNEIGSVAARVDASEETAKMDSTIDDTTTVLDDLDGLIDKVATSMTLAADQGYAGQTMRQAVLNECSILMSKHFDLGDGAGGKTDAEIAALVAERNEAEAYAALIGVPFVSAPDDETLDQAIRSMTDTELEAYVMSLEGRGALDDVLVRVDLDTVYRMAEFTESIDPDLSLGIGDGARGPGAAKADWFDKLEYVDKRNWDLYGPGQTELDLATAQQGGIGDCYLIAGIDSLGYEDPQLLTDVIKRNPNGTYTVTFGDGTTEIVTPSVVYDPNRPDKSAFARSYDDVNTTEIEALYLPLVEKAYAQRKGGWDKVAGGFQSDAVEALTGRESKVAHDPPKFEDIVALNKQGANIGLSSLDIPSDTDQPTWVADPSTPDLYKDPKTSGEAFKLATGHAYVVVGVDEANRTVQLVNPWHGGEVLTITADQLEDCFDGTRINLP